MGETAQWSALTTYVAGDRVVFQGTPWVAVSGSTGEFPDSSAAWEYDDVSDPIPPAPASSVGSTTLPVGTTAAISDTVTDWNPPAIAAGKVLLRVPSNGTPTTTDGAANTSVSTGRDLRINTGPASIVAGVFGNAFELPVGFNAAVPVAADWLTGNAFCLEARVKTSDLTALHVYIGDLTEFDGYARFLINFYASHFAARMQLSDNPLDFVEVQQPAMCLVDTWYDVAADWDGSTLRLLVDGVMVGSAPVATIQNYPVGNKFGILGPNTSGVTTVDEVRFSPTTQYGDGGYAPAVVPFADGAAGALYHLNAIATVPGVPDPTVIDGIVDPGVDGRFVIVANLGPEPITFSGNVQSNSLNSQDALRLAWDATSTLWRQV